MRAPSGIPACSPGGNRSPPSHAAQVPHVAGGELDLPLGRGHHQAAVPVDMPGVPYVHTKPGLAFTANVTGYVPSPVSVEPFSLVTVGGQ